MSSHTAILVFLLPLNGSLRATSTLFYSSLRCVPSSKNSTLLVTFPVSSACLVLTVKMPSCQTRTVITQTVSFHRYIRPHLQNYLRKALPGSSTWRLSLLDPLPWAGSTAHGTFGDLSVSLVSTRLLGLWPEGVAHILKWPSPSLTVIP